MSRTLKMVIALALTMMILCPTSVFAAGPIDVDGEISIDIQCVTDQGRISGLPMNAYKVADVSREGEFTLTSEFKKYEDYIDFDSLATEEADKTAKTLKGYVQRDKVTPTSSIKTDANGSAILKGKPGIYLVVADKTTKKEGTYDIVPFLIAAPSCDEKTNEWQYDLEAFPKCSFDKAKDTVSVSVVKIWNDEGFEAKRPDSVVMQLMKGSNIDREVVLKDGNNWRYEWKDLDAKYDWSVVEKPVSGYYISIDENNGTYKITNKIKSNTPKTPDKPKEKLPQTGLLWWPVPLLIIAGLILLALGIYRKNAAKEK